jgi:hypothetical protein
MCMFCSAGLLAQLPLVCFIIENRLVDMMTEQQQQQQQGMLQGEASQQQRTQQQQLLAQKRLLLNLALSLVQLFHTIASQWPAGSNSSSRSCLSMRKELCSAAQATQQLAAAVLAASDGRTAYVEYILESAGQRCKWLQAELRPLLLEAGSLSIRNQHSTCARAVVQQLLQSEQQLRLLAAVQALYAQVLQHRAIAAAGSNATGSSSSSKDAKAAAAGTVSDPFAAAAEPAVVHSSSSTGAASQQLLQAAGFSWTCNTAELEEAL